MGERKNLYFYYKNDKEIQEKLTPLFQVAEENGFTILDDPKNANIIVGVGGDGNFLQAVRKTGFRQDCLYVGITYGDEVGLYCDFQLDHFDKMIETFMHGDLEVRRFPTIDVAVNRESHFNCLNELSIRSAITKSIVIDVFIDDQHFETFRGDGLIVATPTGSSGYNKSTQGAVVDPKLKCFQVTELASLNNNRYRTLGSSFVLSENRKLTLKVVQDGNDYPIIGMDNEAYSIRHIQELNVELSEKVIKTVKLKDNSFWDRMKRTFL